MFDSIDTIKHFSNDTYAVNIISANHTGRIRLREILPVLPQQTAAGKVNMLDGMLTVYKEAGFTSNDVVAKLRGILRQKKIGHTGTLDPDATGVLPVCLGKGTKLCDLIADRDKEYVAVLHLGVETDTQDMSGQVLAQKTAQEVGETVTEEMIRTRAAAFLGTYAQIPPMYSALKVNGKKLYELARAGQTIERKPREVQIYELEILDIALPLVKMRVRCSKGTYIRTLCHDLGQALGVGGAMESLLRTRVGNFHLQDALTLGQIEEIARDGEQNPSEEDRQARIRPYVQPVETFFDDAVALSVTENGQKLLDNGNALGLSQLISAEEGNGKLPAFRDQERVRIYARDGGFRGLYRFDQGKGMLVVEKMF